MSTQYPVVPATLAQWKNAENRRKFLDVLAAHLGLNSYESLYQLDNVTLFRYGGPKYYGL